MYDTTHLPRHNVLCIDMKSFYASCEAVSLGLDPLTAKIAVVGDLKRDGSVVLAASPELKKQHGIRTGSRLFEIKKLRRPDILVVQARMAHYLKISKQITEIFLDFVPPEALHIYSVDESWLTTSGCEKLWGTPWETAEKIAKRIQDETGCIATIGIGDNKFLAKCVLDTYAKKEGIAECRYEDVPRMLHHLPIEEMWGVGVQMKKHFNEMGIYTFKDLAYYDVSEIRKRFGIVGENLYWYSWGVDFSPVFYDHENNPPATAFNHNPSENTNLMKSVGHGVTLLKDYHHYDDIKLVVRELAEEVCERLRKFHLAGRTIHLSVDYSKAAMTKGFSRQKSIKIHTNDPIEITNICMELFDKHDKSNVPVRFVRVSVAKLQQEVPLLDPEKEKRRKVFDAQDVINQKYGKGTIRTASSYTDFSVAKDRTKKIGGHYSG